MEDGAAAATKGMVDRLRVEGLAWSFFASVFKGPDGLRAFTAGLVPSMGTEDPLDELFPAAKAMEFPEVVAVAATAGATAESGLPVSVGSSPCGGCGSAIG